MSWNQASEILQAHCLLGVFLLCFPCSVDVLLLFSSVHSSINNSNKEKPQHQCWMMHPCFWFSKNFICTHNSGEQITEMQKRRSIIYKEKHPLIKAELWFCRILFCQHWLRDHACPQHRPISKMSEIPKWHLEDLWKPLTVTGLMMYIWERALAFEM